MMLFCSTYELSISTGNVFFFSVKIKPSFKRAIEYI